MSTFSGTNLPPIVRLGLSSDKVITIAEGTLGNRSLPKYIAARQVDSWTIPDGVLLQVGVTNGSKSHRKSSANRKLSNRRR